MGEVSVRTAGPNGWSGRYVPKHATCTRHVHMRAFLYKLACVCKSPAYGEGTAVAVQW